MSNFKINDKVVCVDDSMLDSFREPHVQPWIENGHVYTIERVGWCDWHKKHVVFLVGHIHELWLDGDAREQGLYVGRFRLVSEVKAENQAKRAARATGKEKP